MHRENSEDKRELKLTYQSRHYNKYQSIMSEGRSNQKSIKQNSTKKHPSLRPFFHQYEDDAI